jgi:lysophospholipase L1-like esterase
MRQCHLSLSVIVAVFFTVVCASTAPLRHEHKRTPGGLCKNLISVSGLRITVLGDSIASGEGIGYGYTWNASTLSWQGGSDTGTWTSPNPLCHQTNEAYSNVVAKNLKSSLLKLACTGSTFWNGIVTGRNTNTQLYSDAQFGDYNASVALNSYYDGSMPDVVIVTLGANDLGFSRIVTSCVLAARLNLTQCTIADPGPTIQQSFYTPINNGSYVGNYRTLIDWIQARGKAAGKVPRIIMTTYGNPLPPDNSTCPETFALKSQNIAMLNQLFAQQYQKQLEAFSNIPGVWVADLSSVYKGHTWCNAMSTDAPWIYGLSILNFTLSSSAPFHPTPQGQQAIAQVVQSTIVTAMNSCDSLTCPPGQKAVFSVPSCVCQ